MLQWYVSLGSKCVLGFAALIDEYECTKLPLLGLLSDSEPQRPYSEYRGMKHI